MRSLIIIFIALICCLSVTPKKIYAGDPFEFTDVIVAPIYNAGILGVFGGYIGGSGDWGDVPTAMDWSIGNTVPFSVTRTDDMVFSTTTGNWLIPGNWVERMRITKDGSVGIGTTYTGEGEIRVAGDVYTEGAIGFAESGSQWAANAIYKEGTTDFLTLRNYTQGRTVFQILSPTGSLSTSREATLALVRGDEPDVEYIDIYNNGYIGTEVQHGIRIQKRGTGQYRDFVFDFSDDDGATTIEVLRLKPNGNVGIGTANPEAMLHLIQSDTTRGEIRIQADSNPFLSLYVGGSRKGYLQFTGSGPTVQLNLNAGNSTGLDIPITFSSSGSEVMRLDTTGNVGIGTTNPAGKLDVNSTIYQRGGQLHADYVFEPDYALESIREHTDFMWKNKHLAAIPKSKVDENGIEIVEVGSHRKGIVEELEKAHIYISQLERRLEEQSIIFEERLAKLETRFNDER